MVEEKPWSLIWSIFILQRAKLIRVNDLLDDVIFPLSTNQKPRKNLHTHTDDGQKSDLWSEVALAKKKSVMT